MTSQHSGAVASGITADDLAKVSRTKVFFGHQSVGMNILDGAHAVCAAHGMTVPVIEEGSAQPGTDSGFISHAFIGENANPLLKVRDFDAKMRSGIGQEVNVAMMKFCYVDVASGTDTGMLFAAYHESIAALKRDFPEVTFVHVTVPLTTGQGRLSKLKARLTRSRRCGPAENAARERLNSLIRREYAAEPLFDLAAAESTTPDGGHTTGSYRGQRYYVLYDGYAADYGHLNGAGARTAATAWLTAIARASGK